MDPALVVKIFFCEYAVDPLPVLLLLPVSVKHIPPRIRGRSAGSAGDEDLSKLKQAKVKLTYKVREDDNNYFVDITLRNTSGQIAFFNQLQFLNSKMSPIRPSFYTDNFFSLMPGEKKTVTIETAKGKLKDGAVLALKGWNINKQEYKLK